MTPTDARARPARPAGLTSAEAAERLRQHGPNDLPRPEDPTLLRRAAGHLIEPLTVLLLVAAGITTLVSRRPVEGAAILAIVVLNVSVASAQESRAAGAVDALQSLLAPTVRVRRDGVIETIPAAKLVPGDAVEISAGDNVPADLELIELEGLVVSEAVLTGEPAPVDKVRGEHAYAGTTVLRGQARALVLATGTSTRLGHIASQLGKGTEPPLLRELRTLSGRMAVLAGVVGASLVPVVLLRSGFDLDALTEACLAGVALAVAALPEGLATVVVLALALGSRRLAQRGAIVREPAAIEALGAADVLCTDKTGTLTEGTMTLSRVLGGPTGEDTLWWAMAQASGSLIGVIDPIDQAILDRCPTDLEQPPVLARRPFDAVSRCSTVIVGDPGEERVIVKGAPETVLARCCDSPQTQGFVEVAERWATSGQRVLAAAMGDGDDLDADGLAPLGLISFEDPIRATAADAVARCRRGGMPVVLVTGDHPATAESVARAVGIEGPVTTGAELATLPLERQTTALLDSAVIARVEPEQKVQLVDAHQRAGRVVAMTGDGINDAPALRHADVGVALAGVGGTDVAREAADVILTNGDLSVLVDAVAEGRHIRWNLRAVVRYLLTGNLSEVLVVAGALVLLPGLSTPFLPVQLLWLNLVTDGAPALAMAVDRSSVDPLTPTWPRWLPSLGHGAALHNLVPRASALAAPALAVGLVMQWAGWSDALVRSELLLALLITHIVFAFNARSHVHTLERGWASNPALLVAIAGSLVAQVLAFGTDLGRRALGLAALPPAGWALAIGSAVVAIALIDLGRAIGRRHRG